MIRYLKSLFNNSEVKTAIHPECRKLIQEVTTIKGLKFGLRRFNGKKLYQFKSLLDMPHKRYNACTRASTEFNMRIDSDTLRKSIADALSFSNEGNFTKVINILNLLQAHTEMLISIDASYRLASVVYFWEDEDLDDYDFEIGDQKIMIFKEMGLSSFFLRKPMNNFLPPIDLSQQDLGVYSRYEKEMQRLLSLQLKEQSAKDTKAT